MGSMGASCGRSQRRARLTPLAWLGAGWAVLAAAPAMAQDSATSTAQVAIVEPLSLASVEDLDFGKVSYTAAGTVVLTASTNPTCTTTGGVQHFGTCTAAVFVGYGERNRTVRIKRPAGGQITLAGPGGATMQVTNVTMEGSPTLGPPTNGNANSNGFRRYQIVSSDGAFSFRVGGTLNVAAGQALGLYSATFDVEIAYE